MFRSLHNWQQQYWQSNLHFQNLYCHGVFQEKVCFWDDCPLCPIATPPLKDENIYFYCRLRILWIFASWRAVAGSEWPCQHCRIFLWAAMDCGWILWRPCVRGQSLCSLGERKWGAHKQQAYPREGRATGRDESQSVPSSEKVLKTRELDLSDSIPSCFAALRGIHPHLSTPVLPTSPWPVLTVNPTAKNARQRFGAPTDVFRCIFRQTKGRPEPRPFLSSSRGALFFDWGTPVRLHQMPLLHRGTQRNHKMF